jgi:hypothetical protein
MSVTKRVGLLAGAATLSLTGASLADVTAGADQNNDRIAALEAEVAELRAMQSSSDFMTEARADQIRGLVQDVLADADTRSSLLQGGPTAGHDGNFFLASPDGNYRLNVGGLLQAGFVYNNRDTNDGAGGDENRWGFEMKRTQLTFWGHVVDPNWMYKIEGEFNRGSTGTDPDDESDTFFFDLGGAATSEDSSCNFCLLDAWIAHNCGNGLIVYVGQFRAPFLHEEFGVDDQYSLAYDRSALNEAFTSGYVQGIMLHYRQDMWEIWGSYDDGPRTANTTALGYDTEYSFHVRGNWLIAGTWDQQMQHTSPRGQEFGARVGGAIRYMIEEFGTVGPGAFGEAQMFSWTIDGSVHFGGASIMAAIIGNHIEFEGAGSPDFDPIGFMVQGGFYLTDEWELFGRYEWADPDLAGIQDLSLLTLGVNYYFAGQQVKWTADVVIGLDEVDGGWTGVFNTGDLVGLVPDTTGNDGQFALRTQLQLVF